MAEQHIDHTIVVYGSTRIPEPGAARRKVEALRALVRAYPGNEEFNLRLAAAERILAKSYYYDVAREFGRLVGEAASRRAVAPSGYHDRRRSRPDGGCEPRRLRRRRQVGGAEYRIAARAVSDPDVTPDLCFRFHYFALRKLHLLLRAKALVAFPGGYGTFDELFEVLTLVQTRTIKPIAVILVGELFWRRAVDFDYLVEEGVTDLEDRELFWFAETADDIWNGILDWYEAAGEPLST